MSAWLAPPLLVAMVVMVLFALIPSRFAVLRAAAVVGWAAIWVDGVPTTHWLDLSGAVVVVSVVGVLASRLWPEVDTARPRRGGSN